MRAARDACRLAGPRPADGLRAPGRRGAAQHDAPASAGGPAQAQGLDCPLLIMDTAPAAVLGAALDPRVAAAPAGGALVANIGNFHTLVFRLGAGGIEGLFEHHTGEVDRARLEALIAALADSTLQHRDVCDDMGHGALVYEPQPMAAPYFLAVTGPRRSLLAGSAYQPYLAVPYGDMMLAGCYGLLRAMATHFPIAGPIRALAGGGRGRPPWDLNDSANRRARPGSVSFGEKRSWVCTPGVNSPGR